MYSLKPLLAFLFLLQLLQPVFSQSEIMRTYQEDATFTKALKNIISDVGLDSTFDVGEDGTEQVSFVVIDLHGSKPVLGGVNPTNFIYPASVYKMYVAMEILKQVSEGRHSLYETYVVKSPNDVDTAKEIFNDPRPLLQDGDTVTLQYLLDLMITRSDNSAANCLIDVASRTNINRTIHENHWDGSEVTRKFLSRKFEDPGYDTIRSTETCALHAADFMFKIYSNTLINSWVSRQMKTLLGRQLDVFKLAKGLPDNTMFYHKSGWWSYYTHDVGIVMDDKVQYIIALFTPVTEDDVLPKFKEVSERVYQLMVDRSK